MAEVLRFGILGVADITQRRFAPAVKAVPEVRVVAVASRSIARAVEQARTFGAEPVETYEALLARSDVDAVYVATASAFHAHLVVAAARAGKHVLCEKPLATDETSALAALAACEKAGVALLEGFAYRFHPQIEALRRLVTSGELGAIRSVEAQFGFPPRAATDFRYERSLGGGALNDAGVYTVHACRWLTEQEPARVTATLAGQGNDSGVDLQGAGFFEFASGATGSVAFGFQHAYRNAITVWGSEGRVTLHRAFSPTATHEAKILIERSTGSEERSVPAADQFVEQLRAFAAGRENAAQRAAWALDAKHQASAVQRVREAAAPRDRERRETR